MVTLQITDNSPQARRFLEHACTLPYVHVQRKKREMIQEETFLPMTMDEFNGAIDRSMADEQAGRTLSHSEAKKRIASWLF